MSKAKSIGDLFYAAVLAIMDDRNAGPAALSKAQSEFTPRAATAELEAAERARAERAEQQHRIAVEMKDAGKFPARFVDAALAPSDTPAMRLGSTHLASKKTVLVLAGSVGCGKTTAAAWIALNAGGSSPGFIRAASLERRGRYDKRLDPWLESRSSLVIDDLGDEVVHDVFRSLLDEVCDMFYADGRRLVITTNLLEKGFVERYGQRLASRLSEVGSWASCGNRDLRRDQLALGGAR
jgi:DNA replication protein DnaC